MECIVIETNKILIQIERTTLIQIDGHFCNKIYPANMFHDPLFFQQKNKSNPVTYGNGKLYIRTQETMNKNNKNSSDYTLQELCYSLPICLQVAHVL